ncbi:MAG: hypothetical protein RDU76_06125 [Candidatus Edwardsbacteria bacterium]|nr:hypothetical protein [Candidatus Edwardsbacteria bacterium]
MPVLNTELSPEQVKRMLQHDRRLKLINLSSLHFCIAKLVVSGKISGAIKYIKPSKKDYKSASGKRSEEDK